jgi:lysophospholipase L1-like esterase
VESATFFQFQLNFGPVPVHSFAMNRRIPLWLIPLLFVSVILAQSVQGEETDAHFQVPATDDGLPGTGPIRRHDWFLKTWAERRSAWAKRVQQDQNALVFLGDSITQGWGDNLDGAFPGVKVANRGINGDTTRGVLIRLREDVLLLHPVGVVILIGTNDIEDGADPETIAANLRLILAALEENDPKMPIILCQVFPSSPAKSRPPQKIKQLNKLSAKVVKCDTHVTFIETWPVFANATGDAKIEEFPDLLHPNKIGYAKWAAALHPILATLGFVDNEPDKFTPDPGFESLFDGHDLTGWGYRPTSPEDIQSAKHWHDSDASAPPWPIVETAVNFDGQTSSPDGRYVAKNGRLIVTTPCEFRKIQKLSTTREFPKDFVLKLEFRATPDADSGVFIREPQLQCRDYLIAGPYKDLKRYKPQDWNEMVITVKGQEALCTCNGEVMESAFKIPATGPIGLEGDRGQMEYRHIEVRELP